MSAAKWGPVMNKKVLIGISTAVVLASVIWASYWSGYRVGLISGLKVDYQTLYGEAASQVFLLETISEQGDDTSVKDTIERELKSKFLELEIKTSVFDDFTTYRAIVEPMTEIGVTARLYDSDISSIESLKERYERINTD